MPMPIAFAVVAPCRLKTEKYGASFCCLAWTGDSVMTGIARPPPFARVLSYSTKSRGGGGTALFGCHVSSRPAPRSCHILFISRRVLPRCVASCQVINRRSTEGLSLTLALVSLVCSTLWLAYGIIVVNAFIYIPNVLGFLFSAVQVTGISAAHTRLLVIHTCTPGTYIHTVYTIHTCVYPLELSTLAG